jgi:stage II sporulation protein D
MTRLAFAVVALLLLAAAPADAASRLVIRGAGYGHGVGMSQYGAMGMASQGWDHRRILAHFYTGTDLGLLEEEREVRVLLQSVRGSASFTGANAGGGRILDPARTYTVRAGRDGLVSLVGPRGRELALVAPPLRVTGPDGVVLLRGLAGNGRRDGVYRGALEFRPGSFGGINAINAVPLEHYVQGVVPVESPASWPLEALKAQAVAARTYAVTTGKGGDGWEQYPDTRSQVYGGLAVETEATNLAVQETRSQLVTYEGSPVVTYFFSTSGGQTEDVENTSLGSEPLPWLRSVEDPYDDVSPRHRWGPIRMSLATAGRKLRGLVQGRFRGVDVVDRGTSPRVVEADVVGTRGSTRVTGFTLRARFGLYDTWAYFTSIGTRLAPPEPVPEADPTTGGAQPREFSFYRPAGPPRLVGSVLPARAGAAVVVQRRTARGWRPARRARIGTGGRYAAAVSAGATYRVVHAGVAGPAVRVPAR